MAAIAPSTWKSGGIPGEVKNGWISNFGDPLLVQLVAESMEKNPDLLIASARLDQAQAEARKAGAALAPELDFNASGTKTDRLKPDNNPLHQSDSTVLGASLQLSWELDIWGRLREAHRGALEQFHASRADYDFARQSLAAQVAKAYFLSVQTRLQRDLNRKLTGNFQDILHIVQAQFDAGNVTRQDLANAKGDLATSRQSAQAAETAFNEANRSLETLLGRYPSNELETVKELQAVPPPIPAGLPSQILERRPDVISAEREVAAAFHFTKEAQAARLPRISLTPDIGVSGNALKSLIDPRQVVANFAANLFQPLFDAGLKKAEFDRAQGAQKEAVAQYTKVALNAFQEVENALDNEDSLAKQEAQFSEAANNYGEARKTAELRYKEGATDLASVLLAQRQELQALSSLISAKGGRLTQRVNLHLALGGNFE